MLPHAKLDLILRRHEEVSARLNEAPEAASIVSLSRELAETDAIVEAIRAYRSKRAELDGVETMLAEPALDAEMRDLAESERVEADTELARLETEIRLALLPKDAADAKSAILEIRAGTGGDEAALFAGDLFRMYARYADLHRWKVEVLSMSEGTAGGYKEIVAEVQGAGVFAKLKFESGVHRVQRVPHTETQGRIHTSAATVAVLPEAEEVDVAIDEKDLKIDTMRAQGAGGQHVNKTESAIRITHLPTNTIIFVQDERSQHKNRARAMALLRSRLYDMERQKLDCGALGRPQVAGRIGRPLRADPHVQLPARAAHRPPHQPDALQARACDDGRGARRSRRRADDRAPGRAARGGGGVGGQALADCARRYGIGLIERARPAKAKSAKHA